MARFSDDDVAYWTTCGPSYCQHHNGPFDKSYRHFSMENQYDTVRRNILLGQKPMVRNTRESGYCLHHQEISLFFVCKLFSPKIVSYFLKEKGSVIGEMLL